LDRENTIAPPGYNRFATVPGGVAVTLSIGSVYAWSTFNGPLTRELGVVAQSGSDWTLGEVVPIFSLAAVCLGVATTTLGPWAERVGPRKVAATAAVAWGGGLALTALGCSAHSLPLLYAGYGVLGGIGWGLGYISPVSNLMKWFPDRRGLATGMALASFGAGAVFAAPINQFLCARFFRSPEMLEGIVPSDLVTEGGKRFAQVAGELREVVVVSAEQLAQLSGAAADLQAGIYLVGTGDTGATGAFLTLSAAHFALMTAGALTQKVPAEGWSPEGWKAPTEAELAASGRSERTVATVHHDTALRTPQFWLLWAAVFGNAFAGVSIISCAKTMMSEVFGGAMPLVVTSAFATSYVSALSLANGSGRFGWATLSDWTGRKNAYYLFGLGIPIVCAMPALTATVAGGGGAGGYVPLALFYGGTLVVVSFYGGLFSVLPAYLADTFGIKHAGAIHGRALTAWSASAVVGPKLLTTLRERSYHDAVAGLSERCDPHEFEAHFGAGMDQLEALTRAKTVTISSLLEICPEGTPDPTATIYDTTLYTMGGVMAGAVLCNAMVGPVSKRFHMPEERRDIEIK
jgi:MFS family permease